MVSHLISSIGYLMDLTLLNVSLTEPERQLSDKMTTYWSNFAKYGNPSPFITDDLPLWLPYSEKKVRTRIVECFRGFEPKYSYVVQKNKWIKNRS